MISERRFWGGIKGLALLLLPIILWKTSHYGIQHDYQHFIKQWDEIWISLLPNADPSLRTRMYAYGPLYMLFAPLAALHELLPKQLFALCWFAIGWWYLKICEKSGSRGIGVFLFAAIFINPFFWDEIARYGHFDILVACSTVAAIYFAREDRDVLSGFSLALGILLKFMPVVILPFLVFHRRKFRWKIFFACLTVVLLGYGVATPLLDEEPLGSVAYIETRSQVEKQSKLLSIFRFLESDYVPWFKSGALIARDYSLFCVAVAGLIVFILYFLRRIDQVTACVAALLATLTFYKVGHPQYYTSLFVILPYWYFFNRSSSRPSPAAGIALLLLYLGVTVFVDLYVRTNGYPMGQYTVRDWVGLPAFLVCFPTLMLLLKRRTALPGRVLNFFST